ncbi:hypothetical protein VTH8203_03864 [Vibrio thalassae]|uniref:Nidogen G2 beta-barrel domain-containing protein n=1 Tax=Vibrio thalassae TaxID=1243014 RepID=A0A240EQE4_9VIBR|nr:hypothetical protein VTH8203_03864 [Vibrio thalassae]
MKRVLLLFSHIFWLYAGHLRSTVPDSAGLSLTG